MPKQELYFEQQMGHKRLEVLKSYDQRYAYEAFRNMNDQGLQTLWDALKPDEVYDVDELPSLTSSSDATGEAEFFLWDELLEQAREQGSLLSFFIVNETKAGASESIYVSPDWPSAEAFAKNRLASA